MADDLRLLNEYFDNPLTGIGQSVKIFLNPKIADSFHFNSDKVLALSCSSELAPVLTEFQPISPVLEEGEVSSPNELMASFSYSKKSSQVLKRKTKESIHFEKVKKQRSQHEAKFAAMKNTLCSFFLRGSCYKGDNCRNSHISLQDLSYKPLCSHLTRNFLKTKDYIWQNHAAGRIFDCSALCSASNCQYSHTPKLEPCNLEFGTDSKCTRSAEMCLFSHDAQNLELKKKFEEKYPQAAAFCRTSVQEIKKQKSSERLKIVAVANKRLESLLSADIELPI